MTTSNAKTTSKALTVDPETGEVLSEEPAALPFPIELEGMQRVSDLIPTPEQWAEYEQRPFESIVGLELILIDAMLLPSLTWEDKEFAIVLAWDPGASRYFTFLSGGDVFTRKLRTLKEWKRPDGKIGAFPCRGRIELRPSRARSSMGTRRAATSAWIRFPALRRSSTLASWILPERWSTHMLSTSLARYGMPTAPSGSPSWLEFE